MEDLKYIIEDAVIAELLGNQNFTSNNSAILELVKNAYDANALNFNISFVGDSIIFEDDGKGMSSNDIKENWMHVGVSFKDYSIIDKNDKKRVLAGAKGVGRFALSKLGKNVEIVTKRKGNKAVRWITNWNSSSIEEMENVEKVGTKIVIRGLRSKWSKKDVNNLKNYLSLVYNDDAMRITISYNGDNIIIEKKYLKIENGIHCLSTISLSYNSDTQILNTTIISDEFDKSAQQFVGNIDINKHKVEINMVDELISKNVVPKELLKEYLTKVGSFNCKFYFNISHSKLDKERFLYKYTTVPSPIEDHSIVLYRNAFSIASFDGMKDWLGLGIRSRKSPAAATHETGKWRVRQNQLFGRVEIDKNRNNTIKELSNRQGFEEDEYYELFIEIILAGIEKFEEYRQTIVRLINKKNKPDNKNPLKQKVTKKVIKNPNVLKRLDGEEISQFVNEIIEINKNYEIQKQEKIEAEERYRYDVRILNLFTTIGLKSTAIAHELKNDRNVISENTDFIIMALKKYKLWDILNSSEYTSKSYRNVPELLSRNEQVGKKLLTFLNSMLNPTEKQRFEYTSMNIKKAIKKIINEWSRDYTWINIILNISERIEFSLSEDILQVIFDNLILNSIQQNSTIGYLDINIKVTAIENGLYIKYADNGKGLDRRYLQNPKKILEVHESTREDGHGLGMWIINNTIVYSGGEVEKIYNDNGFVFEFFLGGKRI